jgi:hypothetical protein
MHLRCAAQRRLEAHTRLPSARTCAAPCSLPNALGSVAIFAHTSLWKVSLQTQLTADCSSIPTETVCLSQCKLHHVGPNPATRQVRQSCGSCVCTVHADNTPPCAHTDSVHMGNCGVKPFSFGGLLPCQPLVQCAAVSAACIHVCVFAHWSTNVWFRTSCPEGRRAAAAAAALFALGPGSTRKCLQVWGGVVGKKWFGRDHWGVNLVRLFQGTGATLAGRRVTAAVLQKHQLGVSGINT